MRGDSAKGAGGRGPLRVLMLSWEYPPRIVGGIARHVDELSHALAAAGVEVDVLTAHHPGAPAEELIFPPKPRRPAGEDGGGRLGAGPGRVRVLRASPTPINPLDFVCEIHQLDFGLIERLLRQCRPAADPVGGGACGVRYDVVHAHDWLVAFAARSLRHGLGAPLVATIHATEAGRQSGIHTPMQHYIHSVEWLLTYDAWRVICCSQAMAGEVQGALAVPADKMAIIPNGVDPNRLRCDDSPAELAEFRKRWSRGGERIILFVGRLVREKGVQVLIDAMPRVLAAHPEARLVVAGGGWWGDLARQAAERGVGHKVTFAGFVSEEDLRRLYAVADAAVYPSLYEPFGIVALEAMAAGVPAVTSDIGGFREVVRHGETGLHTWANNPDSLAWGVIRVLSDPTLAARLRRRGAKEVRKRFAWAGIAGQTMDVYEAVCALAEGEGGPPQERQALPWGGPGVRPRYVGAERPQALGGARAARS